MNKSKENGSAAEIEEQAGKAVEWARTRLAEADEKTRSFVSERPLVALLGAAGLGYLVARILTRRR